MVSLKPIIILTLLISIAVASNPRIQAFAGNLTHDLIVGSRLIGDKLVYQENIVKNGKWFQVIEFSKTFNLNKVLQITQISAKDQITNGTGAFAKVVSGGPTYNNVTMKFTSQRSYGINFLVTIYAR